MSRLGPSRMLPPAGAAVGVAPDLGGQVGGRRAAPSLGRARSVRATHGECGARRAARQWPDLRRISVPTRRISATPTLVTLRLATDRTHPH